MNHADDRLATVHADGRSEVMGGRDRILDPMREHRVQGGGELMRQGQGVAVHPQPEGRHQPGRLLAEPQGHRHGQRRQHVRRLNLAVDQTVSNRGPGGVADQRQVQPGRFRETHLLGRDQHRAVGQGQKGD